MNKEININVNIEGGTECENIENELRKKIKENIRELIGAVEAVDLKIGDYVVDEDEDIAEITEFFNDDDYKCVYKTGILAGDGYIIETSEIERKATEEEIWWAKLGRKVNEYKEGDVVQILIENPNGAYLLTGEFREVDSISIDGSLFIEDDFNRCPWNIEISSVNLVCPVENRVDV